MSTKVFKGTVTDTYEKDWTDRDTGDEIVLYSFKIDSSKMFFRTGTEEVPAIKEGNYIEFTADGQNVDTESVAEGEAPKAAPKAKAKSSGSGYKGKGKSSGGGEDWNARQKYWEEKERRDIEVTEPRISYSAAQRNAVQLVCTAMEQDLLSFGNAAKGKKLDMLVDFVEETTLRLAQLQLAGADILNAANSAEKEDE